MVGVRVEPLAGNAITASDLGVSYDLRFTRKTTIRNSLEKRFDTGYIDEPNIKEIGVAKGDTGWQMTADYEKAVPLFGNLHLLMVFNSTVVIN